MREVKVYEYFYNMLEDEFLPRFILLGLSVDYFWDLTPREIKNTIKQYNRDLEYNLQIQSRLAYTTAIMNAEASIGKLRDYNVYFPKMTSGVDVNEKDMELKRTMLNYAYAIKMKNIKRANEVGE